MSKKFYVIILLLLLFVPIIYAQDVDDTLVKAKITHIQEYEPNHQTIKVKILEGDYINRELSIDHLLIDYCQSSFQLYEGSTVLLRINTNHDSSLHISIVDVCRSDNLKPLAIFFLLAVILFGRMKGLLSITSLGLSGVIILKFMIPMIQKGYDPVWIAILCSSCIILVSFILISGLTSKSLVAILGTISGTIIAGILAQIFTKLCCITGLTGEEVNYLITELGIQIDYRGLYLSGVLIGSIGVVMDVAMTITSVIFELKHHSPNVGWLSLMRSGLKVGKDVMATMVNTLILAYVGGSMPLFLMILNQDMPIHQIMSMEIIGVEIIRSLCGSIGLILTIPFTSFIASTMVLKKK